jgi:D-glycero-alpha-D-manno-heptose-7-phosphate kinase
MEEQRRPWRAIKSIAPIRICDNGGWTDTWFAEYGKVFNIAVSPYAQVEIEARPYEGQADRIVIHAKSYGDRYAMSLDRAGWDRHPLLEAAIVRMGVPDELAVELTISSEAPVGASTGTSAAVTVALLGALDRLAGGRLTPHQIAYTAQSVEVDMLGQQCGIQDQLCSAYGGINFIEITAFPQATVSQIRVRDPIWRELERRLTLIFLGRSHSSSEVHKTVIRELEDAGPGCRRLDDLRATAERSRDALMTGDFEALGRAMIDNTEAQGRLHRDLITQDARRVIEIARNHGALGWKVNGAGGEGGSLTLLSGSSPQAKRTMIQAIERENALFQNIPIRLSRHGLCVQESG